MSGMLCQLSYLGVVRGKIIREVAGADKLPAQYSSCAPPLATQRIAVPGLPVMRS